LNWAVAIGFLVVTFDPWTRLRAHRRRSRDGEPVVDWAPMLPPKPGPARLRIVSAGPDPELTRRLLAIELGPSVPAVPDGVLGGGQPIELPDGAQAERLRDVLRAAGATVDLDRTLRPGGR